MYNLLEAVLLTIIRFPGRVHTVEIEFAIIKALASEIMGQNLRLISKSDIFSSKLLLTEIYFLPYRI